jgi:hypothetical protein
MRAKHPGVCPQCHKAIVPGDRILWKRGLGAWHDNCQLAEMRDSQCTNCGGSGALWNNRPCGSCDGTGSRKVQEFGRLPPEVRHPKPVQPARVPDNSGIEDRACGDLAYEDACARACGL